MRKIVPVLLVAVLVTGCAAKTAPVSEPARAGAGSSAVAVATSLIGTPYRNGGTGPDGFDCSGFTQYVYREAGVPLPRDVPAQFAVGEQVGRDRLRPGDLVFFAIDGRTVSHVGLVVGPDTFVHAPSSRGRVREESLSLPYWSDRYAGARRVAGR